MERKDFDRKLMTYICESGNLTQGQIAESLKTSNSALHNKMKRGTLPLMKLWNFMAEKNISIPDWAEPLYNQNISSLSGDNLESQNQFLKERLLKAEAEKERLLSLLEDMVSQRERLLAMFEKKSELVSGNN